MAVAWPAMVAAASSAWAKGTLTAVAAAGGMIMDNAEKPSWLPIILYYRKAEKGVKGERRDRLGGGPAPVSVGAVPPVQRMLAADHLP